MSYPAGFESRPAYPDFAIYDDQLAKFTHHFRHAAIGGPDIGHPASTSLKPISYELRRGVNTDAGNCEIVVQDHDSELVERDTGKCKIRIGSRLFFYFARGGQQFRKLWFSGEIAETGVSRPSYNQQFVKLTSLGIGNRLAHIYVNVDFSESSPTDGNARISELVKRVLTNTDIRIAGSDPGLGTADIETTEIRLPHLKRDYQTMALIISELANLSDSVYGVNQTISQTPNLFFFPRGSKRSNFLITNDITNPAPITRDWPVECLCYMRNKGYDFSDSQVTTGFGKIIGAGVEDDFSVDPIYNAILNESVSHIGIPFQVSRPELSELSVHMNHTAGPIPEFTILKVSDANQDDGDVVVESQRAAQTVATTRKWYKVFDFGEPESRTRTPPIRCGSVDPRLETGH